MTLEIARVTSRGQVVIPAQIRKELGIKTGDSVAFKVDGSQAILTPVTNERLQALEDLFAWGRRIAKIKKIRKRDILPAVMDVRYGKKAKK